MAATEAEDDQETLTKTLFTESFPESWRDSPDFAVYLAELCSSGVDRLAREPDRLAEERDQVLQQTQDLAFHNYKTFIKTADCTREIFQDFLSVENHVESLLDKLPGFSQTCDEFMKAAQEINTSRRLNSLTLARHTQLLEILEIPQLMDTCVRNGYYEEALELASYVKRLERKLSNIPIVQKIVTAVQSSTQLMLSQLLQQLRSSIQLPACLRVIGYLRRLEVFHEAELRIKFLQARDAWLKSVLSGIPADDPYYHITKTIEASRVHLFDIVTQYRAIFSDDDPLLSMEDEESPTYSNLFHCWIVQKVSHFLEILEKDLNLGVGGRLDSLLGQCMYFGLSFSRVGADFRGLLPPLFQSASLRLYVAALQDATKVFEKTMSSYTLQSLPSVLTSTVMSTTIQKSDEATRNLTPPFSLLEHPPLAAYINAILSAFNGLRHCAPLALAYPVRHELHMSLTAVVEATCTFHRTEAPALNEKERLLFTSFAKAIVKDLVPFIDRCLAAIFPPNLIIMTSSSTLSEGPNQPMGLKIEDITSSLLPLVPQEIIVEEQEIKTEEKSHPHFGKNKQVAKTLEIDKSKNEIKDEEESRKEKQNETEEIQDTDSQEEIAQTLSLRTNVDKDDKKFD